MHLMDRQPMKFATMVLSAALGVASAGSPVTLLRGTHASPEDALESKQPRRLALSGCELSDFTVSFDGHCGYSEVRDAVFSERPGGCAADADELIVDLLGATNVTEATEAVRLLCKDAYEATEETFPFSDITQKGSQHDNEYYAGGAAYNYEIETNDGRHVLKEDAARIGRIRSDEAQKRVIDLPFYLPSFDPEGDGCDIDAAYCCWVQDRQAGDNNGNCNTPYDSQCIDKDPGDNTNFCYADHKRSALATHTTDGYSIFGNVLNGAENIEGAVHCHGFAWAQDETDVSSVYRGNNLFFVSLFDHMYQRGYVRNAPGSAMCGCAENMAVVTRADCTEISADETFALTYVAATDTLSAVLSEVRNVNFNGCTGQKADGTAGRNNDLYDYYQKLVNQGKQPPENIVELRKNLVGTEAGKCNEAIVDFLAGEGIVRPQAAAASMEIEMLTSDTMIAGDAAMGTQSASTSSTKESIATVGVIDPAYVWEETSAMGGPDESMPAVPTDDSDTVEAKTITATAASIEVYEDDTEEDAVTANFDDEDQPATVPPKEPSDGEFNDGEGTPFPAKEPTAAPTRLVLNAEGESCGADSDCASGECLGNGRCAAEKKNNGQGQGRQANNNKKRKLKKWWE